MHPYKNFVMNYQTTLPDTRISGKEFNSQIYYEDLSLISRIPNLVNIQRKSFENFLQKGFIEAFEKNNPLVFSNSNHQIELYFFPKWIQFRKPELDFKNSIKLGKTYGSSVYIPVLVKSNPVGKSSPLTSFFEPYKIEWIVLGFLPLLTPQGHFLINGIPRVVLHQMIRNPGVYTIPKDSRTKVPTIRIVPEQGSWLNITLDKKNRIWVTTRILRRKVSVLIFLQALGFSISEIYRRIEHSEILQSCFVKELKSDEKTRHDSILIRANLKGHPVSQEEAWKYLYAHFQEYIAQPREQPITDENAREFFWKVVWNPKNRYLGDIGRQQFCEKVGSGLSKNQHHLTADDLILATQALVKFLFGERLGDDIDSLINKRVRGCGDFLHDELTRGLKEFELLLSKKFTHTNPEDIQNFWKFNRSNLTKSVSKAWKSFFTGGTLSQFMDETNPLAETTHKRRVTVLGPGGVNSKQTTIQIRGIHPTYYGRLCSIETPEGQNAGLVNSFTVYSVRDRLGNLKTPFYHVYKGQVQKNLNLIAVSPQKESCDILAPADIQVSRFNLLPKIRIPLRKEWKFDYGSYRTISTQSVGILQMISVATSLIPFLEHDDANRALMGSNMQRQAVPLLKPEVALVNTGLETRVISDVNHTLQAAKTGYITSVSSTQIQTYKPLTKNPLFSKQIYEPTSICLLQSNAPLLFCKPFLPGLLKSSFTAKCVVTQIGSSNFKLQNKLTNFLNSQVHFYLPARNGVPVFDSRILRKYKRISSSKFFHKDFISFEIGAQNGLLPFYQKRLCFFQKLSFLYHFFGKNKGVAKNLFFAEGRNFTEFYQKTQKREPEKKIKPSLEISDNESRVPRNNVVLALHKNKELNHSKTLVLKSNQILSNTKSYFLNVYQRTNQSTCIYQSPIVTEKTWIQKGDLVADGGASSRGKLALGKNILVAYLPWEGYNFEDAILISEKLVSNDIFTSLHVDYYEIEVKNTQYGLEKITNHIPIEVDDPAKDLLRIQRLNTQGLIEIGSWVEEGDYLVGKVSPMSPKGPSVQQQYEKLYNVIMQRDTPNLKNTSLRVPKGVQGFVLDVQQLPPKEADVIALAPKDSILRARIVLLQKRKIQVGDKMAGRHGNKGVISKVLPIQDMPYLPDGTPIDIVLNPLGVPSRMNVGQLLEALLGFAGYYLHESYTIQLFDEKFGAEASRSLVYSKLYEASVKTGNPWLFEPHHPGKVKLFDGRTGEPYDQAITVGCAYMLKLVHLVDDKIHARATGPYSAVTQQPVRGRSRNGGQRLGEMEVWALQAYGAAFTLQELLTIKSDDVTGRKEAVFRIYTNQPLKYGQPESFKVLLRELQSLCFNLKIYSIDLKSGLLKSLDLKGPLHFEK